MKKLLLLPLIALAFVGCSQNTPTPNTATSKVEPFKGLQGVWYFDLKASQARVKTKEQKYLLQTMVGESITIDANDNIYENGKKTGKVVQNQIDSYIFKTNNKEIQVEYIKPYMVLYSQSNMGNYYLYYTQKKITQNTKSIENYIHLNRIYRQPKKVYANGYLYYLFMDNGIAYTYTSDKRYLNKEEMLQKGKKVQYKYVDNKLYAKIAFFTVTFKATNKTKLRTSQGDTLVLQ
jgi:hypothetical protein